MTIDKQKAMYEKERGNQAFKDGQFLEAVRLYSLALSFDNTQPVIFCNRAMAYIKLNKHYKAKLDCDEALKLDESYVKAYFRRGLCFSRFQNFDSALQDFRRVLELDSENKEAKAGIENIEKLSKSGNSKKNLFVAAMKVEITKADFTTDMKSLQLKKQRTSSIDNESIGKSTENGSKVPPVIKPDITKEDIKNSSMEKDLINALVKVQKNSATNILSNGCKVAAAADDKKTSMSMSALVSALLMEAPKSAFQFLNAWRSLRSQPSAFCNYLLKVPVEDYGNVVDSCLEPDLISDILVSYRDHLYDCSVKSNKKLSTETGEKESNSPRKSNNYHSMDSIARQICLSLKALSDLKHFGTNKLFFDDKDFENFSQIYDQLRIVNNVDLEELTLLQSRFKKG